MAENNFSRNVRNFIDDYNSRPVEEQSRISILFFFGFHKGRAFHALRPDQRRSSDDPREDMVSVTEFYRAMRGEEIAGGKAAQIELCWVMYEKGDGLIKPLPDSDLELIDWAKRYFGFARAAQKELFADWSYPAFLNTLHGRGIPARTQELRRRFELYREQFNALPYEKRLHYE